MSRHHQLHGVKKTESVETSEVEMSFSSFRTPEDQRREKKMKRDAMKVVCCVFESFVDLMLLYLLK